MVPSPTRRLQRIIEGVRVKSASSRKFVPEGQLEHVITKENVEDVVRSFLKYDKRQEVIDFITKRARKIFSILVLIDEAELIMEFISDDQMRRDNVDAQLPIPTDTLRQTLGDESVVNLFDEKQWEFCAPVFDTKVIPRKLKPETILPYLSAQFITEGAFGRIYRINIHPEHRPQSHETIKDFVRKEIPLDDETYKNEVDILSALKGIDHPNILKMIACYTYDDKHNIISPFIPNGSVRKFLEQERCQDLSCAHMLQLISGLVSAIWAFHELVVGDAETSHKGLHQDLRHDNVLYDGKRLILADFGLSSIKSPTEASNTPFKDVPGYCTAPECRDLKSPFEHHDTTRATDIFALGVIIMEMIVYLIRGPDGLKKFAEDRKFRIPPMCYGYYHKGDTGNERVAEMLREIADEDGSETLKSVTTLVSQMLENDQHKRPLAREIAAQFYAITIQAYLEEVDEAFELLKHSPDAVIEAARFQSWTTALDKTYFTDKDPPKQTATSFTSIIESIQQFKRILKDIDKDDTNLDHLAFGELRQLNDKLLNTLPRNRIMIARDALKSIVLRKIGNDPTDSVYQKLKSVFGEESEIAQASSTKQMVAQMNQLRPSTQMPPPPPPSDFRLLTRTLSRVDQVGDFQIAKIRGNGHQPAKRVLVESIKYQDQYRKKKLLPRVYKLCKILSTPDIRKRLCVLPFYGLNDVDNGLEFGIMYDLTDVQGDGKGCLTPINLQSLLEKTPPQLESRFRLACKLAESLAEFHDVDWYHKDLTCFSILFCPTDDDDDNDESMWMEKPYMIGFQHSRPAADEFSEGPQQDGSHHRYHDPRYVTGKVRRTRNFLSHFDYYSLGIVLLEIGLWNTVGNEMHEYENEENLKFSDILINTKLPKLGQAMTSKYVDAVRYCLTGSNRGDYELESNGDLTITAKLRFKSKVVTPLRELCGIVGSFPTPPLELKRKRANSDGFSLFSNYSPRKWTKTQ